MPEMPDIVIRLRVDVSEAKESISALKRALDAIAAMPSPMHHGDQFDHTHIAHGKDGA